MSDAFTGLGGYSTLEQFTGGKDKASQFASVEQEAGLQRRSEDEEQLHSLAVERLSNKPGSHEPLQKPVLETYAAASKRRLMEAVMEREAEGMSLQAAIYERLQKAGVDLPAMVIRFDNIRITAQVDVGHRALPSLSNTAIKIGKDLYRKLPLVKKNLQTRELLGGVSGTLKPGRLTLLLGLPGSGKTLFLRTLAGQVKKDKRLQVQGEVLYNEKRVEDFIVTRNAAYVDQMDFHIPDLTVRQTLNFSARCRWLDSSRNDMLQWLIDREKELGITPDPLVAAALKPESLKDKDDIRTMLFMKWLGLDVCADTIVGSQEKRGVSGGQKRRVTCGEMLVGTVRVLMADEISTGLDSATTFNICAKLKAMMVLQPTFLVALLQPAPETVALFDDVILLSQGHIAYHGPTSDIITWFESLGFHRPPDVSMQEWVQELTGPVDQEKHWADTNSQAWEFLDGATLSNAFHASQLNIKAGAKQAVQDGQADAAVAETDSMKEIRTHMTELLEHARHKYAQPMAVQLRLLFEREAILTLRSWPLIVIKLVQTTAIAILGGITFLRLGSETLDQGNTTAGLLFFAVMNQVFAGMPEAPDTIDRLPVLYKHRDYGFFHPALQVIVTFMMALPTTMFICILSSTIMYWLVGLAGTPGQYFAYLLVLLLQNQMGNTLFRGLAAISRDTIVAQGVMSFYFLMAILASGFACTKSAIPNYWIWAYYISPVQYALSALVTNEFTAGRWSDPYVVAPGVPAQPLGIVVLETRDFPTSIAWLWIGAGALAAMILGCMLMHMLAVTFLPPLKGMVSIYKPREDPPPYKKLLKAAAAAANAPKKGIQAAVRKAHSAHDNGTQQELDIAPDDQKGGKDDDVSVVLPGTAAEDAFTAEGPTKKGPDVEPLTHDAIAVKLPSQKEGALPFRPVTMTFKDIKYSVPAPKGATGEPNARLMLLKGITGLFRPGVLTALMGESGAGKTTLLDVLAGRKTTGTIEGDIRLNGYPKETNSFNKVTGYVEQTDTHVPQLTVEEAMRFSARLRLPADVTDKQTIDYAEEVMHLVELDSIRSNLTGLPGVSGLSVEQRKRLSIGVELAGNPSLIFMDEPTSGVDARAAGILMRCVKRTSQLQRSIVATIHQPSPQIFYAFDELLLMKRGGQVIFNGPLGHKAANLIAYFEAVEGTNRYAQVEAEDTLSKVEGRNPADWMLDVSSQASATRCGVDFADVYSSSELCKNLLDKVDSSAIPPDGSVPLEQLPNAKLGMKLQIQSLLWRFNIVYWRTPAYQLFKMALTALIAVVFGSMYWGVGSDLGNLADLTNNLGSLFLALLFIGNTNMSTAMPVAFIQRACYYKDKASGVYSALPYVLAQICIEIPYLALQALLYTNIVFFMVQYQITTAHYFWFLFIMFSSLTTWTMLGLALAALMPYMGLAQVLGNATLMPIYNLFAGFMIYPPLMPNYVRWISYINPVYWSLFAMMTTQFGDVQYSIFNSLIGQEQTVPEFIETTFGWSYGERWWAFGMIWVFNVVFIVLTALGLARVNHTKR